MAKTKWTIAVICRTSKINPKYHASGFSCKSSGSLVVSCADVACVCDPRRAVASQAPYPPTPTPPPLVCLSHSPPNPFLWPCPQKNVRRFTPRSGSSGCGTPAMRPMRFNAGPTCLRRPGRFLIVTGSGGRCYWSPSVCTAETWPRLAWPPRPAHLHCAQYSWSRPLRRAPPRCQ